MTESRYQILPIRDLFDGKVEDARRRSYDCLDYDERQCHGRLVLLAWVGGRRFEDGPKCSVGEYDKRWFYLAARSDEPRLRALRFSAECRNRCVCFAGPEAKGKHKWQGVLAIPVFYGKKFENSVVYKNESICRKGKASSPQDFIESHLGLVMLGETTARETRLTLSLRIE